MRGCVVVNWVPTLISPYKTWVKLGLQYREFF